MKVSPDQIRAARALLDLEQAEVAERAKVSIVTIRRLEAQSGNERVTPATFSRVRAALEEAGVVFIPDGVRRRPAGRGDVRERFHKLRGISLCSAARLQGREKLANADLYDENGLPA